MSPHPIGFQRTWFWRGWRIRYTYIRAAAAEAQTSLPVVFIHGFGSSLQQWRSNLPALSQHHTIYAIDLLGFGASEKAATNYSTQLWAEQIYEFWRSFIGQPMVLVGHSLGAVVALAAAVAHPEMMAGLVLLTLPPARQELNSSRLFALASTVEGWFANPLLLRPAFWLFRQPRFLKVVLTAAYSDRTYVTNELITSFTAPTLERGAAGVFSRLAKARTQADYTPEIKTLLPQCRSPILVLWGERDRVVPLSQGKQLPSLNPQLKLVEIPNAGHCLYDECAEQINQMVLDWIEDELSLKDYQYS